MAYFRIEYPKFQAFTDTGALAVGYLVYTYQAGTDTPATTYSNRGLSAANANPIVLNSRAEADIYTSQALKLVLKTPAGATVLTQDYIGEQQTVGIVNGSTVSTSGNVATITGSPVASALTNNLMLVFIPDASNTATMGATASVVAGPDDCVFSGPYTGTTSSTFRVEIDDDSADPETFKWRKDAGSWTTGVAITGDDQTLVEGITVNFAVLVGHTTGDYWTQAVVPPYKINLDSLGAKIVYKNSGGNIIPLESGDIKEDYPVCVVYSSEQACWLLLNTADYSAAAEEATNRVRFEKVANHTLTAADHGNEISFNSSSSLTLTLNPAANFADKFTYVRNSGSGLVTIVAETGENIYSEQNPAGATTYLMPGGGGKTIQIGTNGVDWHVMTEVAGDTTIQKITSTGTYTRAGGVKRIWVDVYGPGGAGDANYGGGGGGYAGKWIDVKNILTVAVTITAGTITSFGSHCSATAGAAASGAVGAGGAGSDGDINLVGGDGIGTDGGAAAGPHGAKMATWGTTTNGKIYGGGAPKGSVTAGTGAVIITEYR